MAATPRQLQFFAGGILLGFVAGAVLMSGLVDMPTTSAQAALAVPASTPASLPARAMHIPSFACGFDPMLVAAPAPDGKFPAPMGDGEQTLADVHAFIAVGNDVARQQRPRDAEYAFITACRIAGRVAGADSPELADAKYALARHYINALPSGGPLRMAALKRAQGLFSEDITLYGTRLGLDDPKTRFASAGFAEAQQAEELALAGQNAPLEVPRVLLAERSTLQLPPRMMTTAMGGPPAKLKVEAPSKEEDELMKLVPDDRVPKAVEPAPVPRRIDDLKLDMAPKSWGRGESPADPMAP